MTLTRFETALLCVWQLGLIVSLALTSYRLERSHQVLNMCLETVAAAVASRDGML